MYLTVGDKFFITGLIQYLRLYIKGCHICQLSRNEKPPVRQLQQRINLKFRPLSRLSMDLKLMPRSHKGYKFILCIKDEVTKIFNKCDDITIQIRRDGKCLNRKWDIKILYTRLYNNGPK